MPDHLGIRVLVTGDDEADLEVVMAALSAPAGVARGLPEAVAAMRLQEFGALVADVEAVQDALVLLRAARRSRPVIRGIILAPAEISPQADGWEQVEQAAFAVVRHPVEQETLAALVEAARADYEAERSTSKRRRRAPLRDPEGLGWLVAERRLAGALRRIVLQWSTRSQAGAEDALLHGVQAAVQVARQANATPEVLLAIADALGRAEAEERTGEAA